MMTPKIVNALSALAILSAPPAYVSSFYKYQAQTSSCAANDRGPCRTPHRMYN